ncbi:hypothetical protein [Mucilaginibacter segetis]|uniref:Uncharacterized protein n=1 Tax=Mucilaginibacter segetis TaxID=2793071 RepID=A0A934UM80_9SPHI|nr:hypothetical protein [Mucilaginibacter segetis]MBK0378607.1 hypothetical protein [Mucilaginibacter segetis]
MYIAYSALRTPKNGKAKPINKQQQERYLAYRATCQKYRTEIDAIQQYIPGWMPEFKTSEG